MVQGPAVDVIVEPVDEAFGDSTFVVFLRTEQFQMPCILKVSDGQSSCLAEHLILQ